MEMTTRAPRTRRQQSEYGRAQDARLRRETAEWSAKGGDRIPVGLELGDPDGAGAPVRMGVNVAYTGTQGDLIFVGLCTDDGELVGRLIVPEQAACSLAHQLSDTVRIARERRSAYADALAGGETEGV